MSQNEEGYLSLEYDWPRRVREGFPASVKLAKEMSDLCQFVVNELARTHVRRDPTSKLSVTATLRMTEFLQAAIILTEGGVLTAARASLRSGFEMAFFLGGLVRNPNMQHRWRKEVEFQRFAAAKARLKHAQQNVEDTELKEKLVSYAEGDMCAAYRSFQIWNGGNATSLLDVKLTPDEMDVLQGWDWKEIAKKGGLEDAYETFYRMLLADSPNSAITAIRLVDRSISYGPRPREYLDTYYLIMSLGNVGLSQSNAILKSDKAKQHLESLAERTRLQEIGRYNTPERFSMYLDGEG